MEEDVLMTLDEEITVLTDKWYKYVSLSHHKDRDCHWYLEKRWSYGNKPYYQAFHPGYIIEPWESAKCSTAKEAETELRNKLRMEIHEAITHLIDVYEDAESLDWFGATTEDLDKLIKELRLGLKPLV